MIFFLRFPILLFFLFSLLLGQKSKTYYEQGLALEKKEQFAEAIGAFQQASMLYAAEAKWDSASGAKTRMGSCYSDLKQLDKSRLETDSAVYFWEKSDQQVNDLLFQLLSQQAKLELDLGNPGLARPYMKKGIRLFSGEDSISRSMKSSMLSQLGASFNNAGIYDSAIYFYDQSLRIRTALKLEPEILGKANLNLGTVYGKAGYYEERYTHFMNALALYKQTDVENLKNEILYVYNNIGAHFVEKGEYETAIPYFRHSLAITKDLFGEKHPTTANILNNVAFYYLKKKEYKQAKAYFKESYLILDSLMGANHYFTAMTLHNLGFSSYYAGEKELGISMIAEAIENIQKNYGPNFPTLLNMYENLGRFTAEKDPEAGIAWLEKARDTRFKSQGNRHPRLAAGLNILGDIYFEQGRTEEAKVAIQQGIIASTRSFSDTSFLANPALEDALSLSHLMRMLHLKARVLENQGHMDAGSQCYELAIEALNLLRNQVYKTSGKANLQEDALSLLADAAEHYHKKLTLAADERTATSLDPLFSVVQQGKAALLTDHLRNDRAIRFGGLPAELRDRELKLQSDISFYQNKIADQRAKGPEADSVLIAHWMKKSLDLEYEQRQLRDKLERRYPAYYELKYNVSTPDLAHVQQSLLHGDEAILEFFVADKKVFAFWITPETVQLKSFPTDSMEKLARDLHSLLRKPGTNIDNVSHKLYSMLISPFVQGAKLPSALTIIPDGMLGYIPFEVFLTKKPGSNDYREYPFLGKQCAITYAYALRLLLQKDNSSTNDKLAAFAPSYPPLAEQEAGNNALAGLVRDGIWDLPGAQAEVKRICELTGGEAYTGDKATANVFRSKAPDYGLLHLAMHALVDDQDPLRSYLVFSQNAEEKEEQLLYASELYGMRLPAQLAVLSACNTGYGSLQRGEGIMSLSRAFAYAGCPSTVMSLWQAPDAETSKLMDGFYTSLSEGREKHLALKDAKMRYLESAYTSQQAHPFYWAGFIVSGDKGPVTGKGSLNWPGWLLGGVVVVLFGLKLWPGKKAFKD